MSVVNYKMKQAHWIGANINDGSSIPINWEPAIDEVLNARLSTGSATDEEFNSVSKDQALMIAKLVKGKVPEVLGMFTGPYIVAPIIKEFLEEHEPGVHQFLPIQIRTFMPVNGLVEHGIHWLLRAPPRVDCLLIEGTVFKDDVQDRVWSRKKDPNDKLWGGGVSHDPSNPLFFERAKIEGRHFWRFAVGARRSGYACSDKFWNFYKANKMLGWVSEKPCQLR